MIWKATIIVFPLIGNSMISKVGKGDKVLIGLDLWIRIKESHNLPIPSFKISEPKKKITLHHITHG
jgi:hypothetical protein